MKSINTYYTTKENLQFFIDDENIIDSSSLLIQVFSASTDKTSISPLLLELTKLFPHAVTTVSTTNNQIIDENILSDTIIITFTQFKETQLKKVDIADTLFTNNSGHYLSKERIELALLGSNDGVWDWSILDNTLYLSPRWKEMLGYKDEELKNELLTWESRVHPDDIDMVWENVQKNIDKETEYYENIHRLKHKDGHWVWILDRGKAQFDAQGKAVRMIGTHTDISKEQSDQLKLAHQAQIIEQIHDSITTTDLKGKITSWNLGSEKTFGYKASEVIGKHISMLYRQEDIPTLKQYIEILTKKGIYHADMNLINKSKELIPISFSLFT